MQDIDIMIAEMYSGESIVKGSVLDSCLQDLNSTEEEFKKSLSEDQLNAYNELCKVSDRLDIEVQLDVVRFMLKFFSAIFNYPKKSD